ncbi:hypothetical protein SJX93_00185 [Streptomyces cyaneofuscatus]|uniref:hypothetical protein n=1 Tax=Streptomyces cyaneofuscatus TaxID=66883 RepID=UPI002D7658CA|nr:hypothetical protein [Streptomyces cyaneofuscatus]WRO08130.1 hypothetical protein SJX93_00185 [Streptomyces cyaneofuscatus]
MRRFSTTALAIGVCLSAATLTFSSPTAASPTAATLTAAADEPTLTCSQKQFNGLTGKLYICPWDDGRSRVFGHLRDSTPANGNTRLRLQMGSYSNEWTICETDRPIDTDYQYGGALGTRVVSSTVITC